MRKIIHHLRKQPENIRTHVLHVSTAVCALVLVFLWVFSIGTNLTNPNVKSQTSNVLEPFSALKDNLVDGYKSISKESPGLKVAE
ncbi:MAG: hypothetical protein Q8O46_02575 [bacterium]|nr:hypothetical protein [bacterium]